MLLYALVQRLGAKGLLYFMGIFFFFWLVVAPGLLIVGSVKAPPTIYDKAVVVPSGGADTPCWSTRPTTCWR